MTTNDDEIAERAESYANCGRASRADRFGHRLLGYNYRLTEFQAAVLIGQLEKLPAQTALRARAPSGSRGASPRSRASRSSAPTRGRRRRPSTTTSSSTTRRRSAARRATASWPRSRPRESPCDGLFYEPVYRSTLFDVDPAFFPALGGRLPWGGVRCPVAEKAAFEESVWLPHRILLGPEKRTSTPSSRRS